MIKFYLALACLGCSCIICTQATIAQTTVVQTTIDPSTTQTQSASNEQEKTKPVSVNPNAGEMRNHPVADQSSQHKINSSTVTTINTITINGVTKTVISKDNWNSQSERGREYILTHPELYYVEE